MTALIPKIASIVFETEGSIVGLSSCGKREFMFAVAIEIK